jgi:hypothetical protein
MEPTFKSSFIPKQPVGDSGPVLRRPRRSGRFHFLTFITFIVFLLSLAATGGAFLYKQFLTQSIKSKDESLVLARQAFQPELIRDITRLDTRINVATQILDKHIAPSVLFGLLGAVTLEKVQLSNFQYRVDTNGNITLSMSADADSFNAVAQQADAFGKSPDIRNPIVSNLALGGDGSVTFAVTMNVDASIMTYKKNLVSGDNGLFVQAPSPFVHE